MRPDGQMIILSTLLLPSENHVSQILCRYELVDGNDIVKTEIEHFKVRLYEPDGLLKMLQEAGFQEIKTHKAFQRNQSPDENDEVIVFECRK